MQDTITFQENIKLGIPIELPEAPVLDESVPHAPKRNISSLTSEQWSLAIRNALRYFPVEWHAVLAPEFNQELEDYGRIYMHRFRPTYNIHARGIDEYPANHKHAAAIMVMIQNNLDPKVAKYPHELITYGGNGAVFQNWAQYLITMKYLSELSEEQTLVMYSGHPMGLFPSHKNAPRVVITNGMMIPNYSRKEDWNIYNALGVTQYGQMTAGSFMYIGPQGIVHGTTITLMNAGRKLGFGESLKGRLFVSSGLGGMSGAQSIAGVISGIVTILAEVDKNAIDQRIVDGYVEAQYVMSDLAQLVQMVQKSRIDHDARTYVYNGNIVDLWEYFAEHQIDVELGSDQTSLHNIDDLGYCPVGYTFKEAAELLQEDKPAFMEAVSNSLKRHVDAINTLTSRGMYFWDYGNAFLKEAGEAGADIWKDQKGGRFKYASYVEDIMGPMCFDYGFGPFRWVCTSGLEEDLYKSDEIAGAVLRKILEEAPQEIHGQLNDNINWIEQAREQLPIVGSKSRILYADAIGRMNIAQAFNEAIKDGTVKGPIVLGRDHHDVSGTDSPFRETANIYDGSSFTADMAVHNVIGDAFRGATWISLHNGGGVGWGEVINGGFGLVLDGSTQSESNANSMLHWDVNNGIARRSWARNEEAMTTIKRAMAMNPNLQVTMPNLVDDDLLDQVVMQK